VVPGADWEQAFHGTWWYAVWLVLDSGVLLESNDKASGHDFWEPGVYCTPVLETARWYARPHVLFGDGAYHRVLFELRVDPERRKRQRQRGGVQWVFNSSAVSIHAMWVEINAPPDNGEERVNEWDPGLEALPSGRDRPELVVNPRDFASERPAASRGGVSATGSGLVSTPTIRFGSISMASAPDSIRLGIPIWAPIRQRRPTSLPTSANATSPDSAADCRRPDSVRSPIRLLDSTPASSELRPTRTLRRRELGAGAPKDQEEGPPGSAAPQAQVTGPLAPRRARGRGGEARPRGLAAPAAAGARAGQAPGSDHACQRLHPAATGRLWLGRVFRAEAGGARGPAAAAGGARPRGSGAREAAGAVAA
ncbi:unnamed protein product, partial [Prorocentrum cordatum]